MSAQPVVQDQDGGRKLPPDWHCQPGNAELAQRIAERCPNLAGDDDRRRVQIWVTEVDDEAGGNVGESFVNRDLFLTDAQILEFCQAADRVMGEILKA